MPRLARHLLLLLGAAVAAPTLLLPALNDVAIAEEKRKPATRKGQVLRAWAYEQLTAAYELVEEEEFAKALEKLQQMEKSDRPNDYERALMLQAFAHIYGVQENYPEAIRYFEECIDLSVLEPARDLGMRYNLGQLYLATERYDEGIRTLKEWLEVAENPAPEAYMALANAYVHNEDYASALPYAVTAVEKSETPKEGWLKLLLALRLEHDQYTEAASVLETLVSRFPRKAYWVQLSAVYASLEREHDSMVAFEMAYKSGFLTESRELIRLAELWLYHDMPYKAARLLERELASERIESSREPWELLANSWLQAQERERAIPTLKRAAALSEDGNLYVGMAQVMVDLERWREADEALGAALEKGKLDRPGMCHLLRGITRFNRGQYDLARRSFERASKHKRTRKSAERWLQYAVNAARSD